MARLDKQNTIALLAPYSGSNLGDGAIQKSIIENIRKLDRKVNLYGITLYPTDTEERHGISCYPITGLLVNFYSYESNLFPSSKNLGLKQATESTGAAGSTVAARDRIKEVVKHVPLIGASLRFLLRHTRNVRNIAREIRAIIQAYAFLKQVDLIVVSGSGQLNDEWGGAWGHPYALFRWSLLAQVTDTQFAVVSVGSGSLRPLGRYFVKNALSRACYRSYRDPGTKEFVGRWQFTRQDLCVPDLAFSLDPPEHISASNQAANGLLIGIGPISFGHPDRWPAQQLAVYDNYVKELAAFVIALAKLGHRVLFFSSSSADRGAILDIKNLVNVQSDSDNASILNSCCYPTINTTEDLLEHLTTVDCVVASRLHGVLLSHVLEKPAIAISWDRKVEAHMRQMNQMDFCLDIHNLTFDGIFEKFIKIERNLAKTRAAIAPYVQDFRKELRQQYERLIELADSKKPFERIAGQ